MGFWVFLFHILTLPNVHSLEGIKSPYTDVIANLSSRWPFPAESLQITTTGPVQIKTWQTPGQPYYMGIEQTMWVNSSFEKLESVIDHIDQYGDLFPGYKSVQIKSKKSPMVWLTLWEQIIPVPFVPNITYEIAYEIKRTKKKKIYLYALTQSNRVKTNDGFIVIENKGPNKTLYVTYNFFDADWGPATIFGPDYLWEQSLENVYLSDLATKIKAENPKLSASDARNEAKKLFRDEYVDAALKNRTEFRLPK